MRSWALRWKLTAWYVAALTFILLIFGVMMSAMMIRQFHRRIDDALREEIRELSQEIASLNTEAEIQTLFNDRYLDHGNFSFQVSRSDGTLICGSPWLRAHPQIGSKSDDSKSIEWFRDVTLGRLGAHRVLVRDLSNAKQKLIIQAVVPYAETAREFREFLYALLIAGGCALVAACVGGHSIARQALTPLEQIIRSAERITAENLNTSIAIDNPRDELGRLAATLNQTFQRLRDSVQRMQRFTADAAHELRTPLTVLRTRMEVALRLPDDAGQYRKTCQIAIDQAERLTALIDQLLVLCRNDAGLAKSLFDDVELKPLLEDVVEILHDPAEAKQVSLALGDIPNCSVSGDDVSLSRAFFNIIDNAIKYTPAKGRVTVTATCDDRQVRISIADTGIGIDSVHLPRVFDRFYRIDPSRSDQTGGAGLGLAICRSIVESHQGEISVSSSIGQGSVFTITLPLIAKSAVCLDSIKEQHELPNHIASEQLFRTSS